MTTKTKTLISFLSVSFIVGCGVSGTNSSMDKSFTYRVTLKTDRFLFTFPKDSFSFVHRDELIKECNDALDSNLKLLNLADYNHLIRVNYHNSRADLKLHTNTSPGGFADVFKNALWMVTNESSKAPTKHELMHLLSYELWGFPPVTSYWMNEGLSTYAANSCSGYNVEQLYSYFLDKKMLIDMDSLSNNFYTHDDMIAYHQAGCIMQWLLEHYGLDKIKELWAGGYAKFENIYGIPYKKVESDIEVYLRKKYPTPTDINWETFRINCK